MSLLDKASLVVTPNAYKESKLYSVVPNTTLGDMDVVRATTATRVNSAGLIESVAINIPRIDYTNGSCPSLLVEPQRTNLLTYSEQFDNIIWLKQNATVTANSIASPSGVSNADSLIASNGTATFKGLYTAQISSAPKSFSFFAKKGNKDWAILLGYNGDNNCWFNVSNGTIGTIGSNYTNAKIENYGNGWYRCSATLNTLISGTNLGIYVSNADNSTSCTGDGTTPSLYIWGAQCEGGAYATSYIPTVGSAVTRNMDVISKTGISSLIGQTEGTIFVEANLSVNASERRIITVSNGTESQRIMFWTDGTILYANFNNLSVTIGTFPIGIAKIALGYTISGGSTTYSIKLNNNTLITGTSATAPNPLNSINIGTTTGLGLILNDRINSVQIYKTRLTNAELAQLTTI